MTFWKRSKEPDPPPDPKSAPGWPIASEPATAITGTQPCTESGCGRQDAASCAYIDRRGRRCPTAWCPTHQSIVDDLVFCRRHAGTLRAIGIAVVERALAPDLDNRAPSLVNWVCADLDQRVRQLLTSQIHPSGAEQLGEERVHLNRTRDGTRRWDRSWKLFDHTGVTTILVVSVDEADDTMIVVRLDGNEIAGGVPPWIERRKRGVTVAPEEDAAERRIFYDELFAGISAAVLKERAGYRTGRW